MGHVRITVLGLVRVTLDGEAVHLAPTTMRVLLRLIAAAPGEVTAEQIYRGVWGEPPGSDGRARRGARTQVQQNIHYLRQKLGKAIIAGESPYRLALDAEHGDWLTFEELVAEGAAVVDPFTAGRLFGRALAMWPGALDPGLPRELADRLRGRRGDALRGAAGACLALGDTVQARAYAERLGSDDAEAARLLAAVRAKADADAASGDLIRRVFLGRGVVVAVRTGDLFEQDTANIAIGFGDTFDTDTDRDLIISRDSVQGQLLERVYDGDRKRLDADLEDALAGVRPAIVEEPAGNRPGKRKRYPIGTTAAVPLPTDDRRTVFAFVHCRQGEDYVTTSTPKELEEALDGLWEKARLRTMYKPLAMPVVGSGASRVDLRRARLIITIMDSFLRACRERGRSATELRIMVRERSLDRTGIDEIRRHIFDLDGDGCEVHDGDS